MKQLYLSGAISNNPNYKQNFEEAYNKLIKAGYTSVINPVEFCDQSWSWGECIRKCLIVLCSHKVLGIAKIETPYKSKGCDLELQIAEALGYEIKTVDEWVNVLQTQHPFGFCHNCGFEFNSELVNEYEIKCCPKCGRKINEVH